MTIAKEAEEYIKEYFKEKRKIELVKLGRGELQSMRKPRSVFAITNNMKST